MTPPPLTPFDVAQHWPFLKRHALALPYATARALDLLSVAQVDARGEAVTLRARAIAGGMTAGEAGRLGVVLRALDDRGVVCRYPGRGARGSLWSFREDPTRWRGIGWAITSPALCQAIRACDCRAASAFVARIPGQDVAQFGNWAEFRLLSRDHARRPGLFPVETRDNGEGRATTAKSPGLSRPLPVDNPPADGALSSLSEEQLFFRSEEEERFDKLKAAIEARTDQPLQPRSSPERDLLDIARRLTAAQVAIVCAEVRRIPGHTYIPMIVSQVADISTSAAVKRAGRSEAWAADGPAPAGWSA